MSESHIPIAEDALCSAFRLCYHVLILDASLFLAVHIRHDICALCPLLILFLVLVYGGLLLF
ncbi:hypothetical protein EDD21DRAFT_360441 [Dissophora ornata]|nr:hypothetical protein EDD21DRAFT_360441 [Dissophora ornata]